MLYLIMILLGSLGSACLLGGEGLFSQVDEETSSG